MKTLLDDAWEKLVDKYNIIERINTDGYFLITSSMIKEFREPRLMTKFDHSGNLPDIFKKQKLSIVPIKRNQYLISHHSMFHRFSKSTAKLFKFNMPLHIESIDSMNITSESIALNTTYLTGMLEDFTGDTDIFPTVSGRMSSKSFSYFINNQKTKTNDSVVVDNSQIEIDGAYEGKKYLTIVEAKKTINNDFVIRQLYYPFRLWADKITKPIKLIFMLHSNSIFSLYEFKFADKNNYNSLKLVKEKHYSLEEIIINRKDIDELVEKIKIVKEPSLPFPQANSVSRIINICEILEDKVLTNIEIQEEYEFDKRQVNYYTDAAMYLNLVEKTEIEKAISFVLTETGKMMINLPYVKRQLFLAERILEHKVFLDCYLMSVEFKRALKIHEIVNVMLLNELHGLGKEISENGLISSTYPRRASTIRKWLEWIDQIVQ